MRPYFKLSRPENLIFYINQNLYAEKKQYLSTTADSFLPKPQNPISTFFFFSCFKNLKVEFFWDPGARLFNPPSHIVEWHVRWSGDGLRGGSGNDFGTGHIPATPRYEQPGYRKTLNLSGIFSFSFPAKTRFHTFYLSGHIWTAKFSPTNYDNLLTVLARLARRLHNIRQTVFK